MTKYYVLYTENENLFVAKHAKTALLWLLDNQFPKLAIKAYLLGEADTLLETECGKNFDEILRGWDEATTVGNLENLERWFDIYIDIVKGEE